MSDYRRDDYAVDILIRGHENGALTHACLSSILRETDPALCQVTYVDNGSSVDSFAHLVKSFPAVQFVRLPFNHGSVRAINVGLALAILSPAPFILLMDNDTEIPAGDRDWLRRFMGYLDDERVAAAGAVTDYVSGMQQAEVAPDTYTRDWEEGERQGFKAQPDQPLLVSFAMMIRKAALHDVGMFDERFEPGMSEDYDWSLRARQAGYRLVVANSVWVKHRGSQTFSKMGFNDLLQASYAKLIDKYGVDGLRAMGIEVQTGEGVTA